MKIPKYQWGNPIEDWGSQWKDRLYPSARSKVLQKWNASGKRPKPESSNEYTKRRIKEETKRTWRSDAADIAHGIGEGALALHPYTAIPYYGAKVGQDVLNGNVNWETALNASIPLFHLSPQAVGLREATNVALEDAANAGSKTARNWRVAREINQTTNDRPKFIRIPSKNLFRTQVYKGGEITDPYSSFVTTDPLYAAHYGKVTPYIFESKSVARAKEPMIGSSDPVTMDMFVYNNTKHNPNATAIMGHDAVTGEFAPSRGIEILNLNPKNLYPIKTSEPSTSLKFFERKPAKISEAERTGVPKGERNVKQGYLLKDAIEEANKFAEKWGYDKLSQNATLQDIENLYNQHNTFFRGVTTEQLENTRNRVAKELGINPEQLTNDQYLQYVSTHPWPGNDRIWVTPFSHYGKMYGNSDMIGGKGQLSAVMRPWKTTKDIKQWPKLSQWTLGFKEDVSNPVITPWVSNAPDAIRSLGSQSEFLVKSPLIYRGLGKDFKGTLQQQLKYNDGQGKLGWIESQVGELPQEIIIEKQGGKMNTLQFLKNGSGMKIKESQKSNNEYITKMLNEIWKNNYQKKN